MSPDAAASRTSSPSADPWVRDLTIDQVLRRTAAAHPEGDALVFVQTGERWTWQAFEAAVDEAARGLLSLGLARGDHFGIWAANVPEWVILQFAAARIGVVLVTINPAYRTRELEFALAQSEVRGLALIDQFKASDYFAMLDEICPELRSARPGELQSEKLPRLKWLIRLRGTEVPGMVGWRELLAAGRGVSDDEMMTRTRELTPDDPINLQYTSGTTGNPKGVLLTHRNLMMNAFYAGERQKLTPVDRICIPVPLYHCFGCVLGTLVAAVHGAAMIFPAESFHTHETLQAIAAERCTAIYGVPTMFIAQLESPEFAATDTSSLRTGIMAGSPCPIELMKRVTSEMGAREITIGYGQTEASPLITMTRADDPLELRVSTVGRPLPGVEVKIIDPESGLEVPDGTSGELCGRGHGVMRGYYNMPQQTAEAIDPDGWLHTGDMALRRPDGYLKITGRLKDMIIRGGENISPREIEEALHQHPHVEDAYVVGVPDHRWGEEVLACIRLRTGETTTDDEIRQFCSARLAHFKVPRYVRFVEGFPTTVTGKVQKFRLREQAIQDLGLAAAASEETA
jgi:fatty-acyl-CoA synthase